MTPKQHAEKILKELGINDLPIPVDKIATSLGAKLSYEPFEGKDEISGMLFKDESSIVIGINSSHSSTRQRFSIAHEIGHLVMHHGDFFVDKAVRFNRDGRSSLAVDKKEIEANGFAAELLMPEKLITDAVRKRLSKKPNTSVQFLIDEIAGECQVSPQAMEFRLTNLGVI